MREGLYDAHTREANQPVSLLQLLTRDRPLNGDEVRAVFIEPSERQGPLAERVINIRHETRWHWWNRFGPLFAGPISGGRG